MRCDPIGRHGVQRLRSDPITRHGVQRLRCNPITRHGVQCWRCNPITLSVIAIANGLDHSSCSVRHLPLKGRPLPAAGSPTCVCDPPDLFRRALGEEDVHESLVGVQAGRSCKALALLRKNGGTAHAWCTSGVKKAIKDKARRRASGMIKALSSHIISEPDRLIPPPHLVEPRQTAVFDSELDGVQAKLGVLQPRRALGCLLPRVRQHRQRLGQGLEPEAGQAVGMNDRQAVGMNDRHILLVSSTFGTIDVCAS